MDRAAHHNNKLFIVNDSRNHDRRGDSHVTNGVARAPKSTVARFFKQTECARLVCRKLLSMEFFFIFSI